MASLVCEILSVYGPTLFEGHKNVSLASGSALIVEDIWLGRTSFRCSPLYLAHRHLHTVVRPFCTVSVQRSFKFCFLTRIQLAASECLISLCDCRPYLSPLFSNLLAYVLILGTAAECCVPDKQSLWVYVSQRVVK